MQWHGMPGWWTGRHHYSPTYLPDAPCCLASACSSTADFGEWERKRWKEGVRGSVLHVQDFLMVSLPLSYQLELPKRPDHLFSKISHAFGEIVFEVTRHSPSPSNISAQVYKLKLLNLISVCKLKHIKQATK